MNNLEVYRSLPNSTIDEEDTGNTVIIKIFSHLFKHQDFHHVVEKTTGNILKYLHNSDYSKEWKYENNIMMSVTEYSVGTEKFSMKSIERDHNGVAIKVRNGVLDLISDKIYYNNVEKDYSVNWAESSCKNS